MNTMYLMDATEEELEAHVALMKRVIEYRRAEAESWHTPGPWGLAQYSKGFKPPLDWRKHKTVAVMAVGQEPGDVAYMHAHLWGDKVAEANARLIAMAPLMYLALDQIARGSNDWRAVNIALDVMEWKG